MRRGKERSKKMPEELMLIGGPARRRVRVDAENKEARATRVAIATRGSARRSEQSRSGCNRRQSPQASASRVFSLEATAMLTTDER